MTDTASTKSKSASAAKPRPLTDGAKAFAKAAGSAVPISERFRGAKTRRIAARVAPALLKAAIARTGRMSDSEIIELGLLALATADDFALRMLELKGTVPQDMDLGI